MYEMVSFFLLPLNNQKPFWIELGIKSLKITLQLIRSFFAVETLSNCDQKSEYDFLVYQVK